MALVGLIKIYNNFDDLTKAFLILNKNE
jgi:hypothetical protein